MSSSSRSFAFVDLFAGIGGFHAALGALGGAAVYAVEKDEAAATVYERNWRMPALGDLVADTEKRMRVPEHDVLAAGFPCQPFSKSGYQRGMDEARGTLFWNILEILRVRRPSVVLLENVRNLAGPRHTHEWDVIIRSLRDLGYRVSATPLVFSPHLLPPERGGRPQVRERVFILGTYVGKRLAQKDVHFTVNAGPVDGWDPQKWVLEAHLPLDANLDSKSELKLRLSPQEMTWIEAWNDFVATLRRAGVKKLPGFPVWKDAFVLEHDLVVDPSTPAWKADFLRKNAALYTEHQSILESWLARWNYLEDFPPSRRKLEWQAQDAKSLYDTVMHLRPSGLRAKRPTYLPALVAITQTSILGDRLRRLSPREAARLQGLPEWFDFGDQPDAATYKQLGNGVNVGAAYHVFRQQVLETIDHVSKRSPELARVVALSDPSPDVAVERHWDPNRAVTVRQREAPASDRAVAAAG
ncbi:MAG: DNA cytosine methyltransferase [Actinomycetota bacterium]|nr:DNA cytosine methyltransferase [Actinomycetota bacterium]